MKSILSQLGQLLYFLMGWSYDPLPDYWDQKSVVIGFPHTTHMDTVRAFTYIKLAKVNARLLVKAAWFFFPMSIFLKSLGGLAIKRNKAHGFVDSVVAEFNRVIPWKRICSKSKTFMKKPAFQSLWEI